MIVTFGDCPQSEQGEPIIATLGEYHEYIHLEGREAARFFLGAGVPDFVLRLAGLTLEDLEQAAT